jgi:hypothetical protein
MNDPMTVLNALLIPLTAIDGVTTCRIGLEANLTPNDYPLIRLVPSTLTGDDPRTLNLMVYFGSQRLEATDGLSAVYAELFRLDTAIREALLITAVAANREQGGSLKITYRETVCDEDRLPHYKLMAARFDVVEW